jgi:hypothetical protein
VSKKARPGAPTLRPHHPAGAPAGQIRFAHPSERVFAALLDLYEERWEYEPVEFPLRWDEQGSPVSGFRPDFWLPERGSLHRIDDGRPAVGHPQERQGAAHARALSRGPGAVVYQRDFLALLDATGWICPVHPPPNLAGWPATEQ